VHKSRAKYEIKRVLARAGIRARMGGAARGELLAAVRHLKDRGATPATVIDVGVADGTYELYETFPEARHLLVEPMAEFEDALRAITGSYAAEYVLAAADAVDGEASVSVIDDPHATSLLYGAGDDGRRLKTIRLDRLVAERNLEGPYLLKIDVQGAELRALEGAAGLLPQTEAIILETSFLEFNDGAPLFHDVVGRLHELGFVPYDIVGGYTRPLDGALAQCDVVFVPADSPLRADRRFASDEQVRRDENRLLWKARRLVGI
jgi:FkbM family methyltransferase